MRTIRRAVARLGGVLTARRRQRELDEEMAIHLQMLVDDHVRRGMTLAAARQAALAHLGSAQAAREHYADAAGIPLFGDLWRDVAYVGRMAKRNPGFTVVTVLTIAIGVAGPTLMFAMAKSWILDPLPFADAGRLVDVRNLDTVTGNTGSASTADFLDWQREAASIELAAYRGGGVRLSLHERAERVRGAQVTPNFFAILGVTAASGRAIDRRDADPAASKVAVISHAMWQRHFAGDPAVVGRTLRLEGDDHTVIGVLSEPFQFTLLGNVDVWRPLAFLPADTTARRARTVTAIGRLRDGRTLPEARAELSAIAARLGERHPDTNSRRRVRVLELAHEVRLHHDAGFVVPVLFAMMCCVMLVACVNVTNVTLAKARTRRQEVAVRLALGASRARIIRQWLVEHALLFAAAGGIATVLALYGARWVTASIPAENRQFLRNQAVLTIDWTTLAFAVGIAALCGIAFGWLPAWTSARADVGADLRDASARSTAGRLGARLRSALMASEVAFALALLISSGLLIATARNILTADFGFAREQILTFQLSLDQRRYAAPADIRAFHDRLDVRLQQIPGVVHAAAASFVPFGDDGGTIEFFIDGRADTVPAETPMAVFSSAMPGYREAAGLRLRAGRWLGDSDAGDAPRVAVVNETLASRHFSRDALGRRLRLGRGVTDAWTIVGVVADVTNFEPNERPQPQIYVPFAQSPRRNATVVLRTAGGPEALAPQVRAAVAAVDPEEPLLDVATMEERVKRVTAPHQTISTFVAFFGAVTLLLAAVGVYGVVSYTFAQRTREIGIRMALGARAMDVAALVLKQVRTLLVAGVLPGLLMAWALGQSLDALLVGVTPTDWRLYAGMTMLLAGVALAAAAIPARRASRIDPTVALRCG